MNLSEDTLSVKTVGITLLDDPSIYISPEERYLLMNQAVD